VGVIAAERRRFGGWIFEILEESGSATPGEVGVWLVKAPAGSGLATGHLRSFFFEPAAWKHAEHFCRKVARDGSYRSDIVKEALAFQKRDRIFWRSLEWMDTCVDFGPRSAVAAGPGITAAQGRANLAAMRLAADRRDAAAPELLRFVTDRLDQIDDVRAGTFEPSREVLDPEIAPAVRALNAAGIKTVFSCQGIDGLVVIENVELVVQRFHEPLAYVLCSPMSWEAASGLGDHPDISVCEWGPGQLRVASPHPDRNKAFRQAVVTLGHDAHQGTGGPGGPRAAASAAQDPSGRTEYHRGPGRQRPLVPPGSNDALFVTFLRNGQRTSRKLSVLLVMAGVLACAW
jgi:hypothetical protein